MELREAMGGGATVTPERTLAEATRQMTDRAVNAATVAGDDRARPGIVTQRDVLRSVAAGRDPTRERVEDHFTAEAISAAPDASLEEAAETMIGGGFRHLLVVDASETVGVVSMRDIVRRWLAAGDFPRRSTPIREAMSRELLPVELENTLHQAAERMVERNVGSAVVLAGEGRRRPQLVTERVVMDAVARGVDVDRERVADHLSAKMTYSAPGWSLRQAAEAMTKGGFEHVLVVEPRATVGLISMRDIVRRWTQRGSSGE